jgi:hypothetical protein
MRCGSRGNARASSSATAVLRGHWLPCDDVRLRRVGASVRERRAPGRPARTQARPRGDRFCRCPTGWWCEGASRRRFVNRRSQPRWAARVLPAEPGSRGVSAFTIARFRWRYVHAHQIYRFRWRGASGESASALQALRSFWRPREQPQRRARLHLATRFPALYRAAPPAEAGGPELDRRSSCSTYLDPFHVCTSHPLPPNASAAQRFAGVPRAGLPRGARLPGPSAPAAGWAGPMHGPRWPLRNPNDGTRPPPRR